MSSLADTARVDAFDDDRVRAALMPIGKAPCPEDLPALCAKLSEIRHAPHRPLIFDADPSRRADGFDQQRIDEIKAAMLGKGGGRP